MILISNSKKQKMKSQYDEENRKKDVIINNMNEGFNSTIADLKS